MKRIILSLQDRCEPFMRYMNVSEHIAHHLVGEDHTIGHQRFFGFLVMIVGVGVAQGIPMIHHTFILHFSADVIGYGLHGIGLIPFAAKLEHKIKSNLTHNKDE